MEKVFEGMVKYFDREAARLAGESEDRQREALKHTLRIGPGLNYEMLRKSREKS